MLYPERVAEESKKSITRRRFLQLSGLGAATGLLAYSGEFERHDLQITQRTIELKRLSPALEGLRIAQVSDVHFEQYTEPSFVRHVVDEVNRLSPDLVVFTGDYVSEGPMPKLSRRRAAIPARKSCLESPARSAGACWETTTPG